VGSTPSLRILSHLTLLSVGTTNLWDNVNKR
jgi:hypothetical protein